MSRGDLSQEELPAFRNSLPHDAECARIREKLLGDGPLVPAIDHGGVESDARRVLREKLLEPDTPAAEGPIP